MLRLDRLLTLYCFNPLRKLGTTKNPAIPILMYHSISDSDEQGVHPYFRTCTSPLRFVQHISWLREHGYMAISLGEASDLLSGNNAALNKTSTEKYVVVTFDDGYRDVYLEAFPVLKKNGFQATVFLATAYVGGEPFKGRRCLSWPQIREMYSAGIAFGSHTHTHPQLRNLPRAVIAQELKRSKNIIEDELGSPVTDFSYPYKFPEENSGFNKIIREELARVGYVRCVTTIIGRYCAGDDALSIKRLPVTSDDDEVFFDAKLKGSYDWLHTAQVTTKKLKRLIS